MLAVTVKLPENWQKQMWICARFHPLLLGEYWELVHRNKQLVALNLQLGTIKLLQMKREQRENFNVRKVSVSLLHTDHTGHVRHILFTVSVVLCHILSHQQKV